MLNEQSKHLAYIIAEAGERQARTVEASAGGGRGLGADHRRRPRSCAQQFAEECTPGYYNNEGQPSALAARNGAYGRGPIAFVQLIEAWRAAGELEGLELA